MFSIIYKDGKEVCRIEHTGTTVVAIEGEEKDIFIKIFNKYISHKYIWEILADDIMDMGYKIRTRHD